MPPFYSWSGEGEPRQSPRERASSTLRRAAARFCGSANDLNLAHFWEFRRPHCGHAKINIASCPLIMLCVLCPGLFIYISGSNPTTGFLGFSLPITLLVWLVPFVVLRGQLRPLARNTIIVGMDCPICLESFKDTAFSLVCGTQYIRFGG